MDYSYLFRSAKIKKDSLEAAGFSTTDGATYTMSPTVSGGAFRADIALSLTEQTLTVHLFDTATGEKYALFDMPSSHGAFVASLREEVQMIIDEIRLVTDAELTRKICTKLVQKFTDDEEYLEKELKNALPRVQCLELEIEHMTGKLVNES